MTTTQMKFITLNLCSQVPHSEIQQNQQKLEEQLTGAETVEGTKNTTLHPRRMVTYCCTIPIYIHNLQRKWCI